MLHDCSNVLAGLCGDWLCGNSNNQNIGTVGQSPVLGSTHSAVAGSRSHPQPLGSPSVAGLHGVQLLARE
jgi:hypothetical protein